MSNGSNFSTPESATISRLKVCAVLLIAAGILSGCAGTSGTQDSFSSSQARRYAEELSQRGDHGGAARQYLDIANNSEGAARNRYLIMAAREAYLSNDLSGAELLLAQMAPSVTDINAGLWATVSAEVKLASGQPQQALAALERIPPSDPDATSPRTLLLKAEALFQLGQAEDGARAMIEREAGLRSKKDRSANQRLMYRGLQSAGSTLPARPSTGDAVVDGWLVLGYVSWQQRDNYAGLQSALGDWRAIYPEHPASDILVPELLEELGVMLNYPSRVALLLPLSGRQASTAEAIRDGFLAAHFANKGIPERPEIMVFDTSAGAIPAYDRAMRSGADFVVGPLLKDAVADISGLSPKLRTLSLNSVEDGDDDLFQFTLSPEDEARQVAQRAVAEGRTRAIALAPASAWGERVLNAFTDELEQYGGQLLDANLYESGAPDYAENIKQVLLLDQGEARHRAINQTIGINTNYEPRIRQDADFIFLAANNKNGGMIRPQLRFHYAGAIPTYATSAIYQPGAQADNDLNGIQFPDSPWVIGTTSNTELSDTIRLHKGRGGLRRQRFYAMGFDAYKLMPFLNGDTPQLPGSLKALTGELSLDQQNEIHRTLSWATIKDGKPYPLPEMPKPLLDDPVSVLFAD